jgi:dienelactone hydrolase
MPSFDGSPRRVRWLVPVLILFVALNVGGASAANLMLHCTATPSVGYRVLALEDGRKVAVWYPAAQPERSMAYSRSGDTGRVATNSPPLGACPRVPLVVFSHEFGGCALQSIFITEELARHGYVVAAPDHRDAGCPIGSDDLKPLRADKWFLAAQLWSEESALDRAQDLRDVMHLVAQDPALAPVVDASNVGAVGHSLGAYTVMGMAGGWQSWKTPELKAVIALSPFIEPFVARGALNKLGVPVMYQTAWLEWDKERLEIETEAYRLTSPPKYFVELKRVAQLDFEWTNLLCLGQADVAACLKNQPNAAAIDRYAIAFLDHYLKGKPQALLDLDGSDLNRYLWVK